MNGHPAAVLALLAACGGNGGSSDRWDAAAAAPPDAALPADYAYVMDSVRLAETADQAGMVALDLDGDGQPDNALGGLFAALNDHADLGIAAAQAEAVESGHALTLIRLEDAFVDEDAVVPVRVSPAIDLDGDPSDNFSGDESFSPAPLEGTDDLLAGTVAGGHLLVGPGAVPILLAVPGDPAEVIALVGLGGRIGAELSAGAMQAGRLGAAFTQDEVHTRLIPAMAAGIDAIVQRDCPDAVCEPGTPGADLAAFFDDDGDGRITVQELEGNSLISSTVGNPDLDLFDDSGRFNPRVDGVKDSLSFGFGFTAVAAAAPGS